MRFAGLLIFLACVGCTTTDARRDAQPDAMLDGSLTDAAADTRLDVQSIRDVDLGDAPAGWRYFTEIPNCKLQVALDPKSVMPQLIWTGCPSNHADCQRFDTTNWRPDKGKLIFSEAHTSGNKQWMSFIRNIEIDVFELDVYNRASRDAVSAFRYDLQSKCSVDVKFGVSKVLVTSAYPTKIMFLTGDMPSTLTSLSPFLALQPAPTQPHAAVGLSDDVMALDQQSIGRIIRAPLGSTAYASTSALKLFTPVVVGDDVFAHNEYGATGWSREVRVNADGSTTVFREVDKRHVSHFASDGKNLFWTEGYGDSKWTSFEQPYCEIWWAPYTNDPATLAQTAKKLTQCDGMRVEDETQVSFDGFYAVSDREHHTVHVVRAPDGAHKKVDTATLYDGSAMSSWPVFMSQPTFVSKDEVWGIMQSNVSGVAYAKFQLGPWP